MKPTPRKNAGALRPHQTGMGRAGLMRDELTTAQMAERLYVSQVTVRTHISSILRKLRLPNRAAIRRLFNDR
jgi:DNA-binding CsgD family transcriptional regulator